MTNKTRHHPPQRYVSPRPAAGEPTVLRPKDADPASTWAWYVAAGKSAEDRQERLRETPERVRDEVEARVRRIWRHKPKR